MLTRENKPTKLKIYRSVRRTFSDFFLLTTTTNNNKNRMERGEIESSDSAKDALNYVIHHKDHLLLSNTGPSHGSYIHLPRKSTLAAYDHCVLQHFQSLRRLIEKGNRCDMILGCEVSNFLFSRVVSK